jgi:hypothetical protein
VVAASLAVPTLLLLHTDDRTLNRWSQIGQALSPVGVFFSGIAFIGITLTLFLQRSELHNQREELGIAREEQQRSSEIALRQLHTDLIKMAWEKARSARMNVTSGDEAKDLFTAEIDRAFAAASPPRPQSLIRLLRHAIGQCRTSRR